jgi:condensin complex subunit 3
MSFIVHWNAGARQRGNILNSESLQRHLHKSQTFEENSTLEGILGELIIPCVKQKEVVLREKGLTGLGLCCLIAKVCPMIIGTKSRSLYLQRMALNSFQLFVSQIQSAPQALKALVLHIVFDILMVHQEEFLGRGSPHVSSCV